MHLSDSFPFILNYADSFIPRISWILATADNEPHNYKNVDAIKRRHDRGAEMIIFIFPFSLERGSLLKFRCNLPVSWEILWLL